MKKPLLLKIFSLFILALCCTALFAQSPSDELKAENINLKYLEYLIKSQIDSVRESRSYLALLNDSILYMSARDHANYLSKKKTLSIYNTEVKKKKTPQDRAVSMGAKEYYVNEIQAQVFIIRPVEITAKDTVVKYHLRTYTDAAKQIMTQWTFEPKFFAHIISGMYQITGVATWFSKENYSLYVVCDFAKVSPLHIFRTSYTMFPYQDMNLKDLISKQKKSLTPKIQKSYEHGLKIPKESWFPFFNTAARCASTKKTLDKTKGIVIVNRNDSLYLNIYDNTLPQKIMKNRSDGFAAVIVPQDDYGCDEAANDNTPSRKNGLGLVSGKILNPVYKNNVFEMSNNIGRSGMFTLYLGSVPDEYVNKKYEVNLLIFKKKSIAMEMRMRNLCGTDFAYSPPQMHYIDNMRDVDINITPSPDSLLLKIRFDKNSADFNADDLQKLLDKVKSGEMKVLEAYIKAFSSVEGSPRKNKELYTKRAENIITALESMQKTKLKYEVNTKENWDMFLRQIKQTPELEAWQNEKDTVKLRNFVNDIEIAKRIEPYLAEQRYALIKFIIIPKITEDKKAERLMDMYDGVLYDLSKKVAEYKKKKVKDDVIMKQVAKQLQQASDIQICLFEMYVNKKITYNKIRLLGTPGEKIYETLQFNQLIFNYVYAPNKMSDQDFYTELTDSIFRTSTNMKILYNYYAFLFNHSDVEEYGKKLTIKKLNLVIPSFEKSSEIKPEYIQQIKLYFSFKDSRERYYLGEISKAKPSLTNIYQYYQPRKDMPVDEKIKLAKYFMLFNQNQWAAELLEPLALIDKPNHEALITYLKLKYSNLNEIYPSDYYQLLMDSDKKLTNEEWCGLFNEKCGLSFQIFDYEPLRKMYCLKCSAITK